VISAVSRLALAALILAIAVFTAAETSAESGPDGSVSARVKVNGLEVEITVVEGRPPGTLVQVEVRNRSDRPLSDVDVRLAVTESPCLQMLGPSVHHRGRPAAESVLSVRWQFRVTKAGNCPDVVILAQVSAVDADGDQLTMESDARVLQIPR
jgi:hypothetical protein